MAYATASELRDRYRTGETGTDEFELRSDGDLEQALAAASAEIDSYRPQGDLSPEGLDILRDKAMTLARMLAYQDQPLDDAHPVVRDGKSVRGWLVLLARGAVQLPVADGLSAPRAPAAPTRTLTYDGPLWGRYTQ